MTVELKERYINPLKMLDKKTRRLVLESLRNKLLITRLVAEIGGYSGVGVEQTRNNLNELTIVLRGNLPTFDNSN